MSDEIVKFTMPDGTEVSNDPQWAVQNAVKAHEAMIASQPNFGNVGVPDTAQAAQLGHGMSPLQSGQPGVDDEDYDPTGGLGVTGRDISIDAAEIADANGFTSTDPKFTQENPDSNEAALEAMRVESEARSAYADAQAKLVDKDEEEGDDEVPLSDWTVTQLKAEVAKRNIDRAEEDQLSLAGLKKKKELVELLEGDTYEPATETDDGDDESTDDES